MDIFSRKFLKKFRHDPGDALHLLKKRGSIVWYNMASFLVFWRVVFSEYMLNHCLTRASALAFILLLTLIPLVASTAFMFASLVEVRPDQVESFFTILLPFAPQTVLYYLSTFFTNAQKLRGLGIGTLILVTVGLFGTVEESLNNIWKVARSRSFFLRLRTFTMVMVYSPIFFLASFQFRRSLQFDLVSESFAPLDIVPFLLMVLAFTTLIWFVPNTRVHFRSAFLGGLIAGLLFELERRGFGTYVRLSIQTQTIYGAFGILPLFLISLWMVSLIVLFGAQIAYVNQNFRPLLRSKKRWDRRVSDYKTYITFRIMLDCVTSFTLKRPPPSLKEITSRYELTEAQAMGMLKWLIHAGYLHNVGTRDEFVPTRDFSDTPVKVVLDAIEDQGRRVPNTPDDFTRNYVASLMQKAKVHTGTPLEELTFEVMISELVEGERHTAKVAAMVC